ncbi:MAG: circularly permuted type 2 ATP-grasp protein [Burkholderiales bacterium]
MDKPRISLFDTGLPQTAAELVASLAPTATSGHFDELRAQVASEQAASTPATASPLGPHWQAFFSHLGHNGLQDLNTLSANLARQIRDNGVTYNVYADARNPQRPWSLDLFPLIIDSADWQQISAGVLQRVRVLNHVMADVYGPQSLLKKGLLPPALVHGHPGYLRSMHGVTPVGGTHLHIAAFDLARGPDGHWWVVSQRTQAPSGLGYLLENRLSISRLFPRAFEAMQVQRLAATYRALVSSLKAMSPRDATDDSEEIHIALLTPGPYNETYFEHAYLARYLGLTLVEGNDLTVRNERVYLKTLTGLQRVHGLLKRLDDQFLDPLELRADSRLGVPGLLQAIRAGNVLVANAPGSAFLESPALLGFLPALARHLLGEELQLPALPTWWCGEQAVMQDVLPRLPHSVVTPTYPGSPQHAQFDDVLGEALLSSQRDEWAGRMLRRGDEHTVQAHLPLSQMPIWQTGGRNAPIGPASARYPGRIAMQPVQLRVFAVSDGHKNGVSSWRVLPGGLARLAGADQSTVAMQRGGSSADVWALTKGEVDRSTLLATPHTAASVTHLASQARGSRLVTSRAAENLFWLGRYCERAENSVGLAHLSLDCLAGEQQSSPQLLAWLGQMALRNALLANAADAAVPTPTQSRRVFERSLIAALGDPTQSIGVGHNLRALKNAATAVRERLSPEHWGVIVRADVVFSQGFAQLSATGGDASGNYQTADALRLLDAASAHLSAITGAQTDRMTRDDGWRLLSIGRHIERLGFFAQALALGFETGAVFDDSGFEAVLALFDSTITFHAQYQQSRDAAALLDLLVMNRDNPRSLGWVLQSLNGRLDKLMANQPGRDTPGRLTPWLPQPSTWTLDKLCQAQDSSEALPDYPALQTLLHECQEAAYALSDEVGARYFSHTSATAG